MIRGVQSYAAYVSALNQVSGIPVLPKPVTGSPEEIVEKYRFVATREAAEILGNEIGQVYEQLERLSQMGGIEKVQIKNGVFWKAKSE